MKKTPIERVATLAKSRETRTAKKLANVLGEHKQAADQSKQIKGYREEYRAHFDGLTKTGMDGRTLSEYRQFLGDLEDAIDQQEGVVKQAEKKVGETRSEWMSDYHRKSALDQLVETQREEARANADKKKMKEVDEMNGKRTRPPN